MTAPLIREWAIGQGLAGARGPIGYDVQVAYADAFGLSEPERPERLPRERVMGVAAKRERKFTGSACTCGRKWEGLRECHCARCHVHFRSEASFDGHLQLVPNTEDVVCVDPLTIVYRSGAKKGERKYREVAAHHGLIIVRAEERPDQTEIESR